jgi:hypothetical protein
MTKLRKLMKIVMILVGILLLLLVLAFVYAVGLAAYKSSESREHAEAFCSSVQTGQPIEAVMANAQAAFMRDTAETSTDPDATHAFSTAGFMDSYSSCEVTVLNGKVQTKTVRHNTR